MRLEEILDMSIAILCVFLAFILIYLAKLPLTYSMYKLDNRYDNHYPREQQSRLSGFGKRALAAHLNGFESFPAYGIGVLFAIYSGVNEQILNIFCISFVSLRLFYLLFYWTDKPLFRSIVWSLSFFVIIGIYILALIS